MLDLREAAHGGPSHGNFNLQSTSKEAKWDLTRVGSSGWDGQILNRNTVSLKPSTRPSVIEQTEHLDLRDSRVAGRHEKLCVRKRELGFDIEEQKRLGVTEIKIENTAKRRVVEEEVERASGTRQVSKQETQMSLKTRSTMGTNRLRVNLVQSCREQTSRPKRPGSDDERGQYITQETLELVKEPQGKAEEDRVTIETCRVREKEILREGVEKDSVKISSKMEVKKTVIEVPKAKENKKIARIEVTHSRRIYLDDASDRSDNNYSVNLVSKVALETSDVSAIEKKSLANDLFQEMQGQLTSGGLSYEQLQKSLEPFQATKEVWREEKARQKGVLVTVKRDKRVHLISGSNGEHVDSTARENQEFITRNVHDNMPPRLIRGAMDAIDLPSRTLQIMSSRFNGSPKVE